MWGKVWERVVHIEEQHYFEVIYKMTNKLKSTFAFFLVLFSLAGCGPIGDKATSLSVIYAITTTCSLALLITYCYLINKKEPWYLLLFSSIAVVNIGYFSLSISKSIDEALLANRISYLGSVLLPLSMMMIIINTCNLKYKKWLPGILFAISIVVFLITASPGYLDIYYKSVTLQKVNGVSVLNKQYGELHSIYLFYLVGYFSLMIFTITYATIKKKIMSNIYAILLATAVFVNIGVWLLEQLVKINFEFLSVSYIMSELFLLGLCVIMQENEKNNLLKCFNTDVQSAKTDTIETDDNSKITKTEEIENTDTDNSDIINKNQSITNSTASSEEEKRSCESYDTAEAVTISEENISEAKSHNNSEIISQCEYFSSQLYTLTPTERTIYHYYLNGMSTKEILSEMNIKENTLKYHNKNIYSKLGVSSRKQLLEIATALEKNNKETDCHISVVNNF